MDTTDINSEISRRLDELTRRLDRLEAELPPIPAKALGLTRATAHRVNTTAAEVASDVGRQIGRFGSTAGEALSTTVGQTRSAVERTSSTARRTSKEAIGQARAQTERTGRAAETSTTALLDDATRAVEPDGDGRPASLDDWTKADLYERAQELDIDGRSSMSKRELVRAIRSA
jgi:tetrahydromethanopterin S-methyltransferase subunit G